jgi:hypothetical protein
MKHKLTVHGKGERMWAECACGQSFLATYIPLSQKRASLKQQHTNRCLHPRERIHG